MPELKDELDPPFEILEPAEWSGPVVFNSPHSGNVYPPAFLAASRLDLASLRRSEDSFVDELALGVVRRGYPLMRAHFPRCYVDVNREPYELDPRMFEGRLPSFANTRSMRVAGGLGTVARVVGDAQEIYGGRIPVDAGEQAAERAVVGFVKPLDAADCIVHRNAVAVDLLRIADHPRNRAESARHPHRAGVGEGRQAAFEHARIELIGLAVHVHVAAREMRAQQRIAASHRVETEFVDKRILGAAQRRQIQPRRGEEAARIHVAAVRRIEQDRPAPFGRLENLEGRVELVFQFGHRKQTFWLES